MQNKQCMVSRWRLLRLLAPVLAVTFGLMVVLPAFADTITNSTQPFSFTTERCPDTTGRASICHCMARGTDDAFGAGH